MPIFNANEADTQRVEQMWSTKTPVQAYDLLGLPDVVVTNMKDKLTCLPKLLKMNDSVISFHTQQTSIVSIQ